MPTLGRDRVESEHRADTLNVQQLTLNSHLRANVIGCHMPKRNRSDYLNFRHRYKPDEIKLVIIAESPPSSGLFFYDAKGKITEPLFAAFMKAMRLAPTDKEEGLREFQRNGWVLIDATYEPVNALSDTKRNELISRDYTSLRSDLSGLMSGRSIPIVIIKANVCRVLEPKLIRDGFNV